MNKNKETNWKLPIIIGVGVIAVIILCIFGVQSSRNRAVALEEAVYTADSDIKVQEQARVSKVYNIADCVKSYDTHEYETLTGLAESMSKGNDVDNAELAISAIAYNFPELKSSKNYQTLMKELALIENTLAQYRESYNDSVKNYNRYVKGFPARVFLGWTGYEIQKFERLDYGAPVDAPENLMGIRDEK